jgi:hypothetical protein
VSVVVRRPNVAVENVAGVSDVEIKKINALLVGISAALPFEAGKRCF